MATKFYQQQAAVWPDLVGLSWHEAEIRIRQQFPNITIQVIPEGTFLRKGFCPDRVKIVVDGEGKILKPPAIG